MPTGSRHASAHLRAARLPPEGSTPAASDARHRLLAEQHMLMAAHSGLWLQRQIDRATDAAGVVDVLSAYARASDVLLGEALKEDGRGAKKGVRQAFDRHDEALQRGAQQAGISCSSREMDEAFDRLAASPRLALHAIGSRRGMHPSQADGICLHLWSYTHTLEVDLGRLGLQCRHLVDISRHMAGCQRLTVLRLSHNHLDADLPPIVSQICQHFPRLSRLEWQNNAIDAATAQAVRQTLGERSPRLDREVVDRMVHSHAAVLEQEVALGARVAISARRHLRTSASNGGLLSLPADVAQLIDIHLGDMDWSFDDWLATAAFLGDRARNLRHLVIGIDTATLANGPGRPAPFDTSAVHPVADLESLDALQVLGLGLGMHALSLHLGRLQPLITLHLPRLALDEGALGHLGRLVDQLPRLLSLRLANPVADSAGRRLLIDKIESQLARRNTHFLCTSGLMSSLLVEEQAAVNRMHRHASLVNEELLSVLRASTSSSS